MYYIEKLEDDAEALVRYMKRVGVTGAVVFQDGDEAVTSAWGSAADLASLLASAIEHIIQASFDLPVEK